MNRRKKVAIILIYLQNNLGDDLFLEHICKRYPNVDFYVMKNSVQNKTFEKISNLYFSQEMKDYFKEFELPEVSDRVKKFYNEFDACVVLGGSIFMQYNQNWRGKLRNFKQRTTINKNTYVIGANFGPFTDPKFLIEHGWAFSKIKDLCFRDSYSAAHFPDAQNIRYTSDILFSYKYHKLPEHNHIAISLVHCAFEGRPATQLNRLRKFYEPYVNKIVDICTECYRRGIKVSLLSFCEAQADLKIARTIESKCLLNGLTNVKICHYSGDVNAMLDEITSARAVIATRFHAMILGFLFGKSVYPIIYDEKQKYVLQDLNFFGESCPVEKIGEINAKDIVDILLDPNSKNSYESMRPMIEKAIVDSEQQFAALDELLKDGN